MNVTPSMLALSVAERIQLVEDLWDSIAAQADQVAVSDAQRQELERRLALHRRAPDEALSWEVVKTSLKS